MWTAATGTNGASWTAVTWTPATIVDSSDMDTGDVFGGGGEVLTEAARRQMRRRGQPNGTVVAAWTTGTESRSWIGDMLVMDLVRYGGVDEFDGDRAILGSTDRQLTAGAPPRATVRLARWREGKEAEDRAGGGAGFVAWGDAT